MILIKILEIIPRGKQPIVEKALALIQVILCLVMLKQVTPKEIFKSKYWGKKRGLGLWLTVPPSFFSWLHS